MKITSNSYRLPQVKALSGHYQLQNSANKPIIVTAVDVETGERGDYVVKLNASERMHVEARLRELIGAFIAMEMEIKVVEPAIVDVSSEFVSTLLGKAYYATANESLGINVGSKYIKDYAVLANQISLTPQQEVDAQYVFCFDLLIQNADRNFEKPNIMTDGNKLIMLDHELAFAFLMVPSFLRNGNAWEFNGAEMAWISKHTLFKRLRYKIAELERFATQMTNLNDNFWDTAYHLIPEDWMREEMFMNIKRHITLLNEHREEFITNIKLILS